MNKIIKLLLLCSVSIAFSKSYSSKDLNPNIKNINLDSSLRLDKSDGLDSQVLDKKRSHKRRRKVRKPRKGIR